MKNIIYAIVFALFVLPVGAMIDLFFVILCYIDEQWDLFKSFRERHEGSGK